MISRKATARLVGLLYLGIGIPGVITLTYFPTRFLVPRDPAATAARIESAKALYRVCLLADLTMGFLNVCLGVVLYQFFKDVHKGWARLLFALLIVQTPMYLALMLIQTGPLVLLSGASYWSAFTAAQLQALAHGFLTWRENGVAAMSLYWGLWLLPVAILTYKSGFLPRLLGIAVGIAGVSYVITALSWFVVPALHPTLFWAASPLYGLGELGFILYLLIKGVRTEQVRAAA
ncbi:MAG TPA: DUF4386 domain-containing protein [Gemmatimonadaceae bacterium]|nr:DUF4386 domain-containing protein [Gemmatimonadaceae bacterium]